MSQLNLFSEYNESTTKRRRSKNEEYETFLEKFKPKLTTDDCYTPAPVYDAVLYWVKKNCDIDGCNIVRPFYPGGDYEAFRYGDHDVVVDNPPFSIITKIVQYYMMHGIRFFLFAPDLTVFYTGQFCTSIVCGINMVYENGAKVSTSFVSNLFGDIAIMSAPDLFDCVMAAQKQDNVPALPKYIYPSNVLRSTDVKKLSARGITFVVQKQECQFITKLDSQRLRKKRVFGGGYLISDRAAADRAAADRAERVEVIEWDLSERERGIIDKELNQNL